VEQPDADQDRTFTICEHALSLVSEGDEWMELGDGSRIGHWSNRRFRVAFLVPAAPIEGAYVVHVLEVWDEDDKVLSACWGDPEQVEIRSLKPGNWQRDFLEA
jgi:hypothetical protein